MDIRIFASEIIYNIGIVLLETAIRIHSMWSLKTQKMLSGRRATFEVLQNVFSGKNHKTIWFHCSSLGEFEQGRPLLELIKIQKPDYKILLTFYSSSGYEMRKNYPYADCVTYLPADYSTDALKIIKIVNPEMVFIVKYEFWYQLIKKLHENNIPVVLFSSFFYPHHIFFKPYGYLFRKMLAYYSMIFVQDSLSQSLLQSINIQSYIANDTRFDTVLNLPANRKLMPDIAHFKGDGILWIIGSTHPEDVDVICNMLTPQLLKKYNLKILWAPHEIENKDLIYIEQRLKANSARYTNLKYDADILIMNNIGYLASSYYYADFVYIGGGFKGGLHSILEPAVYSKPVLFGPNISKYREAQLMVDAHGAFIIENSASLSQKIILLCEDISTRTSMGHHAYQMIINNSGGSKSIYDTVFASQYHSHII
ncbi:MAG: glycosyltransferase N-terminal domain-containing protein [Cytophagales bacterium]|nr:glycosyltransferase N-terminal domain-containing protein [Cytophagales bacterium]